jgi:hypothetical protein
MNPENTKSDFMNEIEYGQWKKEKATKEAAEKAAKQEADRCERDMRVAESVYANEIRRLKRAVGMGAMCAAVAAGVVFVAAFAIDGAKEK